MYATYNNSWVYLHNQLLLELPLSYIWRMTAAGSDNYCSIELRIRNIPVGLSLFNFKADTVLWHLMIVIILII